VSTTRPATDPPATETPRSWTLRRRLGRWFVVLAVIFVLLSAAMIAALVNFAAAGNDLISRWQPAVITSEQALAALVNQETGVRGYLLTGQDRSLQPYFQYRAAERHDLRRLHDLVGGDGHVRPLLRRFEQAAQRWQREVAGPAIAAVRNGAKLGTAKLDAGQDVFDRLRAASARLTAQIQHRADQARSLRVTLGAITAAAIGLAVLVIAANFVLLWRGLHSWVLGPVERLGAQTRQVADGELRRQIHADGPAELTELGHDVEYMRAQIVSQLAVAEQIQEELRRQGQELARSNADLEQFAYVASHDLSEPLRKVSNFCQLLERQYDDQLDDRARQYIYFAVDGARRMQKLITDLLALSRVGRSTEEFAPVDLDEVYQRAVALFADRIESTGARVECRDQLPTVLGDASLLTSLLENLIGNAIKYRRDDVPAVVIVSAERDEENWTITVADNGIGIDPTYSDRIFAVFQRLHLRDQYGGTGIGLALCRKIVEFHGGRIWLDPVQSEAGGATFRFTLPSKGGLHAQSAD
jgi:signal transduction histidine kinase